MIIAKKNAAYYFSFAAVDSGAPETFKTGLTITDTAYYKDGAGVWTALPITDTFAEIGSTGIYEIDLTAAEMNHDKVLIKMTAAGMADDYVFFDLRAKLTDDLNDIAQTDIVSSGAITTSAGAVSTVTGVSNAVTLPAIPANWITAAGISASALNGKGDWNIGKAGYTLTQSFPANFADLAITVTNGNVTVGTNNDKTGYSISGTKQTLDALNDIPATSIVSGGAITTNAGAVVNVDTVNTTTTNTDMRGTDSAATAAALATVDTNVSAILTDTGTTIPALLSGMGIAKNTPFNNFPFEMVLASDGKTPATGLTVTGQRSLDGGAYVAVTGTITEISNGAYQFDATAADTNGDTVKWKFSAATADDTKVEFITV